MLGVAALLGLTLGPTEVASTPSPGIALEVASPGECADEALLRKRIGRYLAGSNVDVDVSASLRTTPSETGVRASLEVTTPTGRSSRELEAADCAELVDAVALVVAMAVDPVLELPTTGQSPPVDPPHDNPPHEQQSNPLPEPQPALDRQRPRETIPTPTPVRRPTPPSATHHRPRLPSTRFIASLGGGGTGGLLPEASGLVEGVAGMQWHRLRVAAVGHYQFRRVRAVADGSVSIAAWGLGAHGCFVPNFGRVDLVACGLLESGQAIGTGRDLPTNGSASRPWIGLGARAGLDVRITRLLHFTAALQGVARPLTPTFNVAGIGEVHTARVLGGRAIAGLQLRLP